MTPDANTTSCPACGRMARRVLYSGVPAWLCLANPDCHSLWGGWSWLIALLPFNGWFYIYGPDETYLSALVRWWKGIPET